MSDVLEPLRLSEQVIPVPTTISPQAQAFLSFAAKRIAAQANAAEPADQAQMAEQALVYLRGQAASFKGEVETIELGGDAKLYHIVPAERASDKREAAYFDIHGGAFILGGGEMCKTLAQLRAAEHGVEVWAVDYRLAPAHSYPAALDDCMAAYRHVLGLRRAEKIVVAGGSAGGNLAAAMLLRARDEGLPLPAGLILMTPVVDLTGAGDTRQTNRFIDVTLYGGGGEGPAAYLGASDPAHPYLSPILGDVSGWPPTLLSSGTRDLLLSDTVRMHRSLRRAGVRAELHVVEAAPHGGFMGAAPEDHELIQEFRRFCDEIWAG